MQRAVIREAVTSCLLATPCTHGKQKAVSPGPARLYPSLRVDDWLSGSLLATPFAQDRKEPWSLALAVFPSHFPTSSFSSGSQTQSKPLSPSLRWHIRVWPQQVQARKWREGAITMTRHPESWAQLSREEAAGKNRSSQELEWEALQ